MGPQQYRKGPHDRPHLREGTLEYTMTREEAEKLESQVTMNRCTCNPPRLSWAAHLADCPYHKRQPKLDEQFFKDQHKKEEQMAVVLNASLKGVPQVFIAEPGTRETKRFIIPVTPIGAPRLTQRDKWLKPRRPCVQAYFDYRAILQKAVGDLPTIPDRIESKAFIPMPPSWSKKKQKEMAGKPHRQRPDLDNISKAYGDSLFLEDGAIWSGDQEKRWCREGEQRLELKFIWF
jgi:Holliday junction resolvase RusA-like endonuclease